MSPVLETSKIRGKVSKSQEKRPNLSSPSHLRNQGDKDANCQPPNTQKPTKNEKFIITETFGEKISLLFISVDFLKDEGVVSLLGGVFIEVILHKVAFDGNVLCSRS